MKAHSIFEMTRADEVAECWEGVPEALYRKLWNEIVSKQKAIPNIEDNGPADVIGHENLASHWDLLNEDEQKLLNELAAKRQEEFDTFMSKRG